MQAAERALQPALLRRGHVACRQSHERRRDQPEKGPHRDPDQEQRCVRRESEDQLRRDADHETDDQRAALTEACDRAPDHQALNDHRRHADQGERETDRAFIPGEAVLGVEDEGRRQRVVGDVREEGRERERRQARMRTHEVECTDRIRRLELERGPPLARQRLRKDEEAVGEVREAQRRGGPERRPQIDRSQCATDSGPDDEADAECDTEHGESSGALLRRRHVRDVRAGRGEAR